MGIDGNMSAGLCLSVLLTSFVAGQIGPLIETHELSIKLNSGTALSILEVINLGEIRDPLLDPRIPQAKYLSLKSLLDPTAGAFVKVPSLPVFKEAMKKLGVQKNGQLVVVYDCKGMKAAAMAWWLLRAFGHTNVQVLNGGLPKWIREGFMLSQGPMLGLLDPSSENDLMYQYVLDAGRFWSSADLKAYETQQWLTAQVVDVRPRNEFDQRNVRGSINLPSDIICRADGSLRSAIELRAIFEGYRVVLTPNIQTAAVSVNGVEAAEALLALAAVDKNNCVLVNGGWQAFAAEKPVSPVVLRQGNQCESTCAETCAESGTLDCASSCVRRCLSEPCAPTCAALCDSETTCLEQCVNSFCVSSPSAFPYLILPLLLFLVFCLLERPATLPKLPPFP